MIANLVTTLLLALGVATGSYKSESGNAFNHDLIEEEKPITKRAADLINVTETYTRVADYDYTYNTNWYMALDKYYLGANTTTPNYVDAYFNIANTTYRHGQINNTINRHNEFIYEIYTITSYWNVAIEFTLETELPTTTSNMTSVEYKLWKTENDPSNIIDLTLNQTTVTTIENYINTLSSNDIVRSYAGSYNLDTPTDNIVITTDRYRVEPNESISFIMKARYQGDTNRYGEIEPYQMRITGEIYRDPINVEVIDIPNLMFTIITLPFAWYSTAFNLTIFPGTPYQLNFGNLVMTIVAALILLYLIKKIIK